MTNLSNKYIRAFMEAKKAESDVPFEGPYRKTTASATDKSGAKHTFQSRVRHLARQALAKKSTVKESAEVNEADASGGLVAAMNTLLADNFAFYLKAQNYHWNVEGPDFAQYHDFLGKLYEEVHGATDDIAERIRTLNNYAIGSLEKFKAESSIQEDAAVPSPKSMLSNLLNDNQIVINSLVRAFKLAESDGKLGLANYLQDRIDHHEKHAWMLRSLVKPGLNESAEPVSEAKARFGRAIDPSKLSVAAQKRLADRAAKAAKKAGKPAPAAPKAPISATQAKKTTNRVDLIKKKAAESEKNAALKKKLNQARRELAPGRGDVNFSAPTSMTYHASVPNTFRMYREAAEKANPKKKKKYLGPIKGKTMTGQSAHAIKIGPSLSSYQAK